MSIQLKKFLVVMISLLICAGIIAWSFIFTYGKIEITTNQPFTLEGVGNNRITCEKNCTVKVPIGEYYAKFKADGFKTINANVIIQRLRTTPANLDFEYEPILIVGEIAKNKGLPRNPAALENFNLTWDKYNQNAVYIQKNGTKIELMLWQNTKEKSTKITNFYNLKIEKLIWSNQGKSLIVKSSNGFYLVDLEKKLKTSLPISLTVDNLEFSPADKKVLVKSSEPFMLDLETEIQKNLNFFPVSVTWKDEDNLIYAVQTENTTDLYEYSLDNQANKFIFSLEMLVEPKNLRISVNQKSVTFETEEKSYELRLIQ